MSIKNTIIVFCIFIFYSYSVCNGSDETRRYKSFFNYTLDEQHEKFALMSIEEQFGIYVYSMAFRHPSDISFAYDISRRGKSALPFLVDRLEREKEENTKHSIILIFEMMVRHHKVELKNEENLLALINKTILSMEDPYYKEQCNKSLQIILR